LQNQLPWNDYGGGYKLNIMELYKLKKDSLDIIHKEIFSSEKSIQNLIEKNVEELFNLEFIKSEFTIGSFRLDTLCFDRENNSFVVIEYKKGSSYSVIDQGYSYLSLMLNQKSDFILEYFEQTGNTLKKDSIDWSQSRIIFISPSFNTYQKNSVNFKDVPFELWEINKFSNDIISLDNIKSESKESIKNVVKSKTIEKVSSEVKVFGKEDLLEKTSKISKKLLNNIFDRIGESDFSESKLHFSKNYCRMTTQKNEVICYFKPRKDGIRITIMGGTLNGKKKSKNYFEVNDYKDLFEKRKRTWKWKGKPSGHWFVDFLTILKSEKDIEYVMSVIKQKYNFFNEN
jgi:hypothetical protein